MKWCEVIIHTTTQGSEIISDDMMVHGAQGTEIVDKMDIPDPNKPGKYWELYDNAILEAMPDDVLVKGWFEVDAKIKDTLDNLKSEISHYNSDKLFGNLKMEIQDVDDEDWSETWKKYYKPFKLGNRLVVKPTWEEYKKQDNDIVIELDPGMAFGTGTHETTAMCMELLEKYTNENVDIMDVGTGSGILAIAAAKLGARKVLAVDIDPDAVKVAKENIENNAVQNIVKAVQGDLVNGETLPCNLAVANIVADVICMLCGPLKRHLEPNGIFICSGIIKQRANDVEKCVNEQGYEIIEKITRGEWVAFCLRNGR